MYVGSIEVKAVFQDVEDTPVDELIRQIVRPGFAQYDVAMLCINRQLDPEPIKSSYHAPDLPPSLTGLE